MPRWPGVQHVGFLARDVTRASAFYRDVLGFREDFTSERIAELSMGDTKLVILHADAPSSPSPGTHFGFRENTAAAVDEWAARLRAAGTVIDFGPGRAEWGGYVVYFRDPDGHELEIWSDEVTAPR